jgi:hypothetical protein
VKRTLGKPHKFRKDFTPEQYAAYLERKAKNPNALISANNEQRNLRFKDKKNSKTV